ncbi:MULTISPECIES: iron hydrogenase small subunit [unclassified Pseudodesulfovibrio]|uniref:iron hydrogenase small subunit n=1 Tax=unclassified Pseudodesulfovibrio TaxID=2661612 RepID=UPI000FEBE661|nr:MULTISPECIES: iron hydrogenase small subunit [unclassified Pseudodesulfovibrio]MCJ2164380.1 iron hydrogenase small subunit [Pseudodesulfovibrio sp. S3-i]RWU04588.1 hydrogenase small subunit [Pseudodesulfovibrio sp. S3]
MKMNRRGFIKACGVMTGYAVLGLNLTKEAVAASMDFVGLRQKSVYDADANPKIYKLRKSQDNPMIKKIYDPKDGFLHEGPCGHMSHHLLHTHYNDRSARVAALKANGFKLKF